MDPHNQHWIVTVALVTSSLIALMANLLFLLVFCRRRGLRTVSNRFMINLLLTNLLSSLLLIPLLIVDRKAANKVEMELLGDVFAVAELFGNHTDNSLCYVAHSTVGFVCTASILSILLIGIDQYFAVIHSLRYHTYINKFRSMMLITSSWLVAIVFAVLSGLTQSASNIWQFCKKDNNTATHIKTLNSVYAATYFSLVTFLPFVAICGIYVCIYAAAHNSSERMRLTKANHIDNCMQIQNRKAPSETRLNVVCEKTIPKVQSAPNMISLMTVGPSQGVKRSLSERTGFITNLKYRISNASVFRYREETRAARISCLVILMVLACYVPYGVAVVLNSNLVNLVTPQSFNFAALVLLMLSNIVSPFLFVYRNRKIRREVLKFLNVIQIGDDRRNSILPNEVQKREQPPTAQPFLENQSCPLPPDIILSKLENKNDKRSMLERVCSTKTWTNYKKCSFITVPKSCYQIESARGSFSSASTQISTDDG
ncbi:hypothetical protein FQA39_LY16799 [Lamprigera yunnana]|nr:hypothetical protein FQA39_LY16799 [Lamprigera yunnana]